MPGLDLKLGFDTDLTIRHAVRIKAVLAEGLSGQSEVRLAINPDAAVDLSFVQLASAARQHAETAGGALSLAEPAGAKLRDALDRGGFIDGASAEDLKFWLHSENAQ